MENQTKKQPPTSYPSREKGAPTDLSALDTGKLPPQAAEYEKQLLGDLMDAYSGVEYDDIANIVSPEMFYNRHNAKIYAAILELSNSRAPVTLTTVAEALKRSGELEEVGGAYYLSQLVSASGTGNRTEYYAQQVFERYIKRQLIEAGAEAIRNGFDDSLSAGGALTEMERKLNEIVMQIAGKIDVRHIKTFSNEAVEEAFKRIDAIRKGIRAGITTGLVDLDRITCGWQNSHLIILAARPSMGKTAMMLHFAKSAARAGKAVAVFSLEMSGRSLAERLLLSAGEINSYHLKSGYMTKEEEREIEAANWRISELKMHVDESPDISIGKIRARAKAMKKKGQCDIIFIDYLQLCKEKGLFGRNREQEVSAMSREAKIMAKELNVPVILLSQLSREVEKRGDDKKPRLSDLRDSGSIEQDADMVMFIWRPEYYKKEVADINGNPIHNFGELLIEKNREGACGKAKFQYNDSMTKIYDYGNGNGPF